MAKCGGSTGKQKTLKRDFCFFVFVVYLGNLEADVTSFVYGVTRIKFCAKTLNLFYMINTNNTIMHSNYAHLKSGAFSLDMSIFQYLSFI